MGLALLTLAFIGVSLLEGFGIGIIGPYVALATNPQSIESYIVLQSAYELFGFNSQSSFIAFIGFIVLAFSALRAFLSWWVQVLIFQYGYRQQALLISKLMNGYLSAPYIFHLNKNSAQIIQNVVIETKNFTANVLIPLLISLSSLFVLFSLSLLLCVTNPLSVLVILGIALPLFLFFNAFKGKIGEWGKTASLSEKALISLINDSLGGIKETKIIGCEPYFEERIEAAAQTRAKNMGMFYSYRQAPRYFVEALMIVFLVGFVSLNLILNDDISSLTSTLSIFALASIRIIPAANQVVGGLSNLKNSAFIVDKLYLDLQKVSKSQLLKEGEKKYSSAILNSDNRVFKGFQEVNLDSINFSYPGSSQKALKNISLSINRGDSIALIGKSGSGKTTLVDIILGLLTPSEGDITVDNLSIYQNMRNWQNLIGYIPQSIYLADDTIEKNVAFGVPEHQIDQTRLWSSVEAAQLMEFIETLPRGVKTHVGERGSLLSGGQRQRVGIARALYHGQEILVLDEATAALDNETEKLVTEAINALSGKRTLIIIAHRLTTIEKCDRIYLMKKGEIVASGKYEDIVLKEKVYE